MANPWAHPRPQPKRQLDRFSRFCIDDSRMSLYYTLKIAPFHGGSGPSANTRFLGPTRVLNPNGISIDAAVFAGLTSVTDRQTDRPTDHATQAVTIGHIYVRSTAMRPNNNVGVLIGLKRCISQSTPVPV